MYLRNDTVQLNIGGVKMGGGSQISVQSMTNTDTRDAKSTIEQINRLEEAGCDIVRVAVPDMQAAEAISFIKKGIKIPLVADIHFDYRLAIECIQNGVDKIRINPGNIGGEDRVKAVVDVCKSKNIPIRIGVNTCQSVIVSTDLIQTPYGSLFDFSHIHLHHPLGTSLCPLDVPS